ncbi:MAG: ABC transporter permease [Oscillospiraceae bacterium]|nr:ABC transporter permease [Oscillospiraceae bacterium]
MNELFIITRRNVKLFFKDKGMFFTSLITPLILLVLYSTFLAKVYHDSFVSNLPKSMDIADKLINGCVGGQLFSSLLAVSCVTVAFCSNMIMVHDKVTGARRDLTISPVKNSTLSLSYFIASEIATLIISFVAMAACLLYIGKVGWYLSVTDILMIVVDILLLTLFGTALSSIINSFLSSQGQMSAVGTIVSSGYGFICGAYMPISQFGSGLQKVLSFLPGTYGTSLLKSHAMRGVFEEMKNQHFPDDVVEGIRDSVDCNVYFFDNAVTDGTKMLIVAVSVVVLIAAYVVINMIRGKKTV